MNKFIFVVFLAIIPIGCAAPEGASNKNAPSPATPSPSEAIRSAPATVATPTVSYASDAEKWQTEAIARHVVEPVDEILSITDKGIQTITGPPGTKKLTRLEFLYLAAGVLDKAKTDSAIRKRLTVNKAGKYRFDQVATAVFLIAMTAAYN